MVIWKFPVEINGTFEIKAPSSFRVLSIGVQDGRPVLWAALDPKSPEYTFKFHSVMTGEDFPDTVADPAFWAFRGTAQLIGSLGPFVLHLFQKI